MGEQYEVLAVRYGTRQASAAEVFLNYHAYHEPDRLVVVWEWNKNKGNQRNVVSPGNFLDWQAQNTAETLKNA